MSAVVGRRVVGALVSVSERLQSTSTRDMVVGAFGLVVGLITGLLATFPFLRVPLVGPYVPLLALLSGYLGMSVALTRRDELGFQSISSGRAYDRGGLPRAKPPGVAVSYKILDTSVIIDGRIYDISRVGFVEGVFVVPSFVIDELQHIADSSDVLRRNRGRRGLDVLNRMQKEAGVAVHIYEGVIEDAPEVDAKLVKLARALGAKVVTNDFNLNKVAELHGVEVLNINELANAVKPVVLPGEEMVVRVIRDGKESGQGVAYLDDGTMIVVDGGRRHIGEQVGVLVTSVLQTAAGRMIFAKPKAMEKAL